MLDRRSFMTALAGAAALWMVPSRPAAAGDAAEILARADEYRNFRGRSFRFQLTLVNYEADRPPREFQLAAKILNPHTSLVVYREPASESGKALLMDGRNLWFSTPTISRPIRITPQQRLVGEASNGDVASTDFSGDYDPRLVGEDTVEGVPCVKLELTARPDSLAAYQRLLLWVRTDDYRPVKADFFGPSGKRLKTAWYRRFEALPQLDVAAQLTELEIVNALDESRRTVMRYRDFQVGDVPESHFTTAYLRRLR